MHITLQIFRSERKIYFPRTRLVRTLRIRPGNVEAPGKTSRQNFLRVHFINCRRKHVCCIVHWRSRVCDYKRAHTWNAGLMVFVKFSGNYARTIRAAIFWERDKCSLRRVARTRRAHFRHYRNKLPVDTRLFPRDPAAGGSLANISTAVPRQLRVLRFNGGISGARKEQFSSFIIPFLSRSCRGERRTVFVIRSTEKFFELKCVFEWRGDECSMHLMELCIRTVSRY